MVIIRICLHMAFIWAVLTLLDYSVVHREVPLVQALLDWMRPGFFLVYAVTLAAILNKRPVLLGVVHGLAFVFTWHTIKHDLISPGIAILLGGLTAIVVRAVAQEAHPEGP